MAEPSPEEGMTNTLVRLPVTDLKRLKALAKREERSVQATIRVAIREHLAKHEKAEAE